MSDVQVSVIVPVHNVAPYLPALLDSLAAQASPTLEFVLVDDGSTDTSLAILQAFAIVEPRAVVLRHEQPCGSASARNTGMAAARGHYLGFADADDITAAGAYQALYDFARESNLDVAYSNAQVFNQQPGDDTRLVCKKGRAPGVKSGAEWLIEGWQVRERLSAVWISLVRRDLVVSAKLQFPPGEIMDDELWTPLLMLQAGRVSWLDKVLYFYREHPQSGTQSREPARALKRFASLQRVSLALYAQAHPRQGALASALRWHAYLNGDAALGLLKRFPVGPTRHSAFTSLRASGLLTTLWRQQPTVRLAKRLVRERTLELWARLLRKT